MNSPTCITPTSVAVIQHTCSSTSPDSMSAEGLGDCAFLVLTSVVFSTTTVLGCHSFHDLIPAHDLRMYCHILFTGDFLISQHITRTSSNKPSFSSLDVQLVHDEEQQRYSINFTPAYSVGIILLCQAIKVPDDQEVFEKVLAQNTVMLGQLSAHVFDKAQWPPPPLICNILLHETIELHFCFWPLVNCDWITVQHKPPWPPPTQLKMQSTDILLRPIPWPFWCYHTVALQLEDFLRFNGLSIVMPTCSNLLSGWRIKCCWAYTICQVLNFSGSPCLHLNLRLRVSQRTLQVILVIYALGFRVWFTSCALRIHNDVSVQWKPSCLSLICCYMSNGCVVSSTNIWPNGLVTFLWWRKFSMPVGDSKLHPSKCAMLWLHEYCDYEDLSFSAQFRSGNIRLLDAVLAPPICSEWLASCQKNQQNHGGSGYHLSCALLLLPSVSSTWTHVQVTARPYHWLLLDFSSFGIQWIKMQVMQQHFSDVLLISIILNRQLVPWDPGGESYFLDGCKFLNCLIELKEKQIVLFSVKISWEPCTQFLKQIKFSCTNVGSNTGWSASHISLSSLQAIQLYYGFRSSAYISIDLAHVGTYGWTKVRFHNCSLLDLWLDNAEILLQHMLDSIAHMSMFSIAIIQVQTYGTGPYLLGAGFYLCNTWHLLLSNPLHQIVLNIDKCCETYRFSVDDPCSFDEYTSLAMGFKLKIKQVLFMISDFWRLSFCPIQFYHQVVDDP